MTSPKTAPGPHQLDNADFFANPFWHALNTEHAYLAIASALARRYPADVVPFAALAQPGSDALENLRNLLAANETIWITGDRLPEVAGVKIEDELPCRQMHFPGASDESFSSETSARVAQLSVADAPAMQQLTDLAFPGFFRARTHLMGCYFGIRIDGELISMAGERVALPRAREISAVCTHPNYAGRGFAAMLIRHLLRKHAAAGLHTFLHVSQKNERAIALYERLGFVKQRTVVFHHLRRVD